MERERWSELSAAVSKVDAGWEDGGRYTHRTAVVVRVHLWAVSHDRPVSWACEAENWDHRTRPEKLPDQSTMSRRTRGGHGKRFEAFLAAVLAERRRRDQQRLAREEQLRRRMTDVDSVEHALRRAGPAI